MDIRDRGNTNIRKCLSFVAEERRKIIEDVLALYSSSGAASSSYSPSSSTLQEIQVSFYVDETQDEDLRSILILLILSDKILHVGFGLRELQTN